MASFWWERLDKHPVSDADVEIPLPTGQIVRVRRVISNDCRPPAAWEPKGLWGQRLLPGFRLGDIWTCAHGARYQLDEEDCGGD